MQVNSSTMAEMEAGLGEKVRALRLHRNADQVSVAQRAGISERALRSLEAGAGSTVHTLLAVLRALGQESWLDSLAPVPSINPLTLPRNATATRQRASARRSTAAPK